MLLLLNYCWFPDTLLCSLSEEGRQGGLGFAIPQDISTLNFAAPFQLARKGSRKDGRQVKGEARSAFPFVSLPCSQNPPFQTLHNSRFSGILWLWSLGASAHHLYLQLLYFLLAFPHNPVHLLSYGCIHNFLYCLCNTKSPSI